MRYRATIRLNAPKVMRPATTTVEQPARAQADERLAEALGVARMVPPRRAHQRPADDREDDRAGGKTDAAEPLDPPRRPAADALHEVRGHRLPHLRRRGDREADADDAYRDLAHVPVERGVDARPGWRLMADAMLEPEREAQRGPGEDRIADRRPRRGEPVAEALRVAAAMLDVANEAQ